jgi:phenylalanyl-tRNA synthetase beta chain
MKVTLNWLKQYVDFDWPPEVLAERLTMLGIEVEGVQKLGGEFEGIVVAQILTKDKVAGSDKLSVCKVNDGKGERTIICGAQNHQPGDKVPLILPNFALPLKAGDKEPFVIKERKVFGITSQGMMCSPQELGLPDQVDGLLILPKDAPIGQAFAEFMKRPAGDVLYDLEITPNRPDLNSVIGIAREISALTGNALRLPEIRDGVESVPTAGEGKIKDAVERVPTTGELVAVRIEDEELCPRYTARVVRGVKVGPSPDWLKQALEKVGVRSISNVVDVTNYVMLETGQPLHAFDYHLIAKAPDGKPTIVVRRSAEGEKFTTLDNQARTLTNGMLLIADEGKAIALAGVMGGLNTEINNETRDVLIESAYFKPQNVRATSKKLGLRTEASYRFERGGDIGICDRASRRAAQLILETAGGELAAGIVDAFPKPPEPKEITLRHQKVNDLLGIELRPEKMEFYLGQLGLKTAGRKARPVDASGPPEPVTFRVPSFRVDLKREADLIEEITRMHGIEQIPSTPPRGAIGSNEFDAVFDQLSAVRRILTGLGLDEAQGQTLISNAECGSLQTATGRSAELPKTGTSNIERRTSNVEWGGGKTELVPLTNPLSSDMDVLRPSLLPGLLDSLRHNLSRKNNDVALFETGRVFLQQNGKTREERRVGIALTGLRNPPFWSGEEREAKFDVFDLKGLLEGFFEQCGVRGATYTRRAESTGQYLESATVQLGKNTLGEFGQLSPALAKRHDLRDAVLLAELNLDLVLSLARRNSRTFKALPAFPAIGRDVAMLVPEATTHEAVLSAVRSAKAQNLERVELFDIFRGKNVPEGQKSMAYAFTYRSAERTLTDAEVNAAHEKIVELFKQNLGAVIRET